MLYFCLFLLQFSPPAKTNAQTFATSRYHPTHLATSPTRCLTLRPPSNSWRHSRGGVSSSSDPGAACINWAPRADSKYRSNCTTSGHLLASAPVPTRVTSTRVFVTSAVGWRKPSALGCPENAMLWRHKGIRCTWSFPWRHRWMIGASSCSNMNVSFTSKANFVIHCGMLAKMIKKNRLTRKATTQNIPVNNYTCTQRLLLLLKNIFLLE